MSASPHPSLLKAITRGLRGRCPACGEGGLFWRYLKVSPTCESCGHELSKHPADDGPAYLTILIVGHLVVAPLLFFPFIWRASALLVVPLTLIPLLTLTLLLLPRIKGAFIGALWFLGLKRLQGAARAHAEPTA